MVEIFGVDIPEGLLIVAVHAFVPELIGVRVLMAGIAFIGAKAQAILKNPGCPGIHIVASGAVDPLVSCFERETGLVVVEPSYLGQRRKRFFSMALLAIRAEVTLMSICVATVAIGEIQPGKNLKFLSIPDFFLMARFAFYLLVLAHESEARLVVVEFAGRRESVGDMAARAIVWQSILMIILVAGSTLAVHAQKSSSSFFQLRVADEVGNVALAAVYPAMRPRQLIAGLVVVEIRFIQPHHFEIPAVMLAVATGAVFAFSLPGSMITRLPVEEALNFFMATQAFIIGNLLPQRVALRAIRYPFQVGVRPGQWPRRQLGV